jgi:hypothetical protein
MHGGDIIRAVFHELGHRMQPGRIHAVKVAQESRRGRALGARLHDHELMRSAANRNAHNNSV